MAEPLIDPTDGLRIVDGDPVVYSTLLHLFADDLAQSAEEVPSASRDALSSLLHRVKGAAAGLAAQRLRARCVEWERAGVVEREDLLDLILQTREEALATAAAMAPTAVPDQGEDGPDDSLAATVLVVDDSASQREIMARFLSEEFTVVTSAGAADALHQMRAGLVPDLVLSDIRMPDMDGFELCRRIQASAATRHIPVIFVTAVNDVVDEEHGLEVGAADYVRKPLRPALLLARVRNQIRLKQQSELLARASRTDTLTGLGNRRDAVERLDAEWLRSRRSGSCLALLMIDIDHFKSFNDSQGHLAGDTCLIAVAQAVSGPARRPADAVCRWGGEEFLAILPETDPAGAHIVGQSMVADVALLDIANPGIGGIVTVSVGAAATPADHAHWRSLVERADASLYQAKAAGRGRCFSSLES